MLDNDSGNRLGFISQKIVRHRGESQRADSDYVAEECPVALVFNDISHAVMMATPKDLREFAVGFSLTEGIVQKPSEIFELEVMEGCAGIEVRMTISQKSFFELKAKRRALAGRTGCGVCGIESLELLDLCPGKIAAYPEKVMPSASVIERASHSLPGFQSLMHVTGGVHAAAWCSAEGEIIKVFEDVGRHNGLDKLIGFLALQGVEMRNGFVFMSSRASYELVRKVARMNIPMLATISAPTSLAIEIARMAGVSLVSFCRKDGFVEYVV
ncbi:formate dehydrogenase accessory sulfurtransferase FdhD [Crenobacter sp. SG2303]|uniref:Sulfur carrier protein FdhD n=1 Tax=Crenobacter oryzisoli TaxID=3056844 RepID=A0ABT7XIB6_9NEIS|nr:formate dehydrogenase accessory sulfurtransferase FdhD [Crenobacter sp. SG2303]MDN0073537.1 formate dehydrogenase accessory sulfurtransferase FdhD [Crenobacter sp. SG2303]